MEITFTTTKTQRIQAILFRGSNLIINLVCLFLIITGIILLQVEFKYGFGFICGGSYYLIFIVKRIIKAIMQEESYVKLRIEDRDLWIFNKEGMFKLPYNLILNVIDSKNKIHIKISKNFPLKSCVFSKKYIKGNVQEFVAELYKKISMDYDNELITKYKDKAINQEMNSKNEYILTLKNSFITRLLQTMDVEYRKVGTIFLFTIDLLLGLMLYFGDIKLGSYILFSIAIIVLLKPLFIVLLRKPETITEFYVNNNKLEIINNITLSIDIDKLMISKNNKSQTVIRSKDNKICFKIDNSEIVKGNTSKLFEYIEHDNRVLNTSVLGIFAIIFSIISFVSIILVVELRAVAVIICLVTWIISLICSIINLLKKNVYKKLALISFINDIIIFSFIVIVVIRTR